MKIYTIFSPSHKYLYENYFLKSLPDEFEVIHEEIPQDCNSGNFYDNGWDLTCYKKIEFYEKACSENMGEVFVFSDVDVQFFGKIKQTLINELGDYDIACQNDLGHTFCSGFWICRGNERTLNLFRQMKLKFNREDQTSLNDNIHLVNAKFLSRSFFTVAHLMGGVWNGQQFNLQYPILVHHANWTVGVNNKIRLLDYVKNLMTSING